MVGSPPYQVEERVDADGRIRRFASAARPDPLQWEDGFSEWQENRRLTQVRQFRNGPIRRFEAAAELDPEGMAAGWFFPPKSNAPACWAGWR